MYVSAHLYWISPIEFEFAVALRKLLTPYVAEMSSFHEINESAGVYEEEEEGWRQWGGATWTDWHV